ncbi:MULTISPECIES: NYN domain-containing protein [Caballeronia]|jgi:cold shock CspA family protein|uniref:NYN domain-containing protein n=1 Tax=Caballeronia TaxID=1827195 RepID=UPI001EF5C648|nr:MULTISPECIES: NYN domain-containing protein [Caballeronia]MCG7405034.1 NYN domain-containing protein [Caballeronia zhejiangensis]MDR5786073.1 NYN domain-containing protein [Caballeronia sp. LP003]MDR5794370.1 NYN domain-containing protein [Caballeronia sp. LZ008]
MSHAARQLTKIGVFYDGNYFDRVSKYYNHQHEKKAWISIPGLHEYIRYKVADEEAVDIGNCQVIDAHYFRGRFSAQKSKEKGGDAFYYDRVVDDMLMRENVTAHYLPMNFAGKEKGIDVWLALEAFDLSIHKHFDVVVLIASDSDYVPLVRKLKTLGIRVMIVTWTFTQSVSNGDAKPERPSTMLLKEVSYRISMSEVIDKMDETRGDERDVLSDLFQRRRDRQPNSGTPEADRKMGTIESLTEKYGYIRPEHGLKKLYFYYSALSDADSDELEVGMEVSYLEGMGQKGLFARKVRTVSS